MDSSRGTDTFLTAIFFWPLHNVDFLLVCWHLKTLILWSNWYSSAASTQYFPALFDVGVIYYPLPAVGKLVHCDKMCEFTRQQERLKRTSQWYSCKCGTHPGPNPSWCLSEDAMSPWNWFGCPPPAWDRRDQPLQAALTMVCQAQMEKKPFTI